MLRSQLHAIGRCCLSYEGQSGAGYLPEIAGGVQGTVGGIRIVADERNVDGPGINSGGQAVFIGKDLVHHCPGFVRIVCRQAADRKRRQAAARSQDSIAVVGCCLAQPRIDCSEVGWNQGAAGRGDEFRTGAWGGTVAAVEGAVAKQKDVGRSGGLPI